MDNAKLYLLKVLLVTESMYHHILTRTEFHSVTCEGKPNHFSYLQISVITVHANCNKQHKYKCG
jgi:hypothetical protein